MSADDRATQSAQRKALLVSRSELERLQISLIVRTEQGMMTMPIVLYEPEEMLAPMSLIG